MASSDPLAPSYEAQHVHSVYEEIASHFSATRYKPWPIVEKFLLSQRPGAIGADIGCGNGKYLSVRNDLFIVGSDRSTNLVTIAKQHQPHDVLVADTLSLPHPVATFDFAISIAVIHHLSTPARRIEAVKAILEILTRPNTAEYASPRDGKEGGQALIYVWALEQKDSRRGWDDGHEQDVMVPWVLKEKKEKKAKQKRKGKHDNVCERGAPEQKIVQESKASVKMAQEEEAAGQGDRTFLRYYHLYKKGELESDIEQAGGEVVESGYEKDNWWAVARLK